MDPGVRVLVVRAGTDDGLARDLGAGLDGATVVTTGSAAWALDRLSEGGIDCVVAGYRLPETDGLALVERLRERGIPVPVVLYTDADPGELGGRAVRADLAGYVRSDREDARERLADRVRDAVTDGGPDDDASDAGGRPGPDPEGDVEPFRTVVEALGDAVYRVDADGVLTYVNRATVELTGYSRSELVGEHVSTVLESGDEGGIEGILADLVAGEDRVDTVELDLHTRSGERRTVENRLAVASPDSTGGFVGVLRDVTDRERRETDIERYETILDALADPVYTLDPDGTMTYVNRTAVETFGYSRSEFVGSHVSIGMEPDDIGRAEAAIEDLVESDRDAVTVEYDVLSADGTRIPVENKIALLPADEGEFRGTAGVLRDVSDRRRRERRLQVLTRFLRHNVRNEVALIENHAGELAASARTESTRDLARGVRDRARALTRISNDVRRLERAIDRDLDDVTPVDAADLVREVLAVHRERFPAARFEAALPETAPVFADSPLRAAVSNVVENAVVHSDRSEPRVWVSVAPDEKRPADRLSIRVADDGPGIPGDVRDLVLGDADARIRDSGGLGLWVATWIVESFGGELTVEDRDPRGSVVGLHLRRADG